MTTFSVFAQGQLTRVFKIFPVAEKKHCLKFYPDGAVPEGSMYAELHKITPDIFISCTEHPLSTLHYIHILLFMTITLFNLTFVCKPMIFFQ